MSTQDRTRWNERYTQQTYGRRGHPSALLQRWVEAEAHNLAAGATAWDVACGTGRNLLYLAQHGYKVIGLDIADVGLSQAADRLARAGFSGEYLAHDLELPNLPAALSERPQLIAVFRYLNLGLLPQLAERLAIGGRMMVEVHLQTELEVGGPGSARFRAAPGSVRQAILDIDAKLTLEHDYEGPITDPDGSPMALAQLVVRRDG